MKRTIFVLIAFFCLHTFTLLAADTSLQALKYRNIGPSRGGRCSAVAGTPSRPFTFLMGGAGGVWQTENAGLSWKNITDGFLESSSIGAIAIADSNPNVIYVGTGQSTLRGNVSLGDGMYKSTDAGKTWKHAGLKAAGQIAKIRVHPKNPDLLYVAVIGNAFVPNADRGIFRSVDGGKAWQKVLFVSDKTGFADLVMDATNPLVMYASAWTAQRQPWTIISGSEEGGLYKTTDGGDNWIKLAGGLPQGLVGKIGVAVAPSNPNRVYALVEAENGGLFRSEDSGSNWKLLNTNQTRRLYQRAWYYMHIFVDPKDDETVYILNVDQFRSRDGGVTFETITFPHGDGHDLWINPENPNVMVEGDDGGATVSLDGGSTWSEQLTQPTAEIYNVALDGAFPYRVYGAQQDNTTISVPSRVTRGLTPYEEWRDLGGGESGHIGFDYHTPNIVFAGSYGGEITRLDMQTGDFRNVMAYPQMEVGLAARDLKYRFNWNAPLFVSRHNPKELYYGSNYVHRTTDEGYSWEVISPDLSRNDISKQDYSGAPITKENTGIEVYSNLMVLEESPLRAHLLWTGSDDGLVHVSEDAKTWRNVTPPGMPEWGTVSTIDPSPHDPARAYVAVHNHGLGDNAPYIFRTNDSGKTWKSLANGKNGIPANDPVRAVREDPMRKGLLYAGTERGMFVSYDDGTSWKPLQLNLPLIPITDIRIQQNDMVLSTQGRSLWILDDLTVIQQIAVRQDKDPLPVLLKPRDVVRMRMPGGDVNPPNGAMVFFAIPDQEKREVTLEFRDAAGNLIISYSSEKLPDPNPEFVYGVMGKYTGDRKVPKNAGLNRFAWDLRYPVIDFPKGTIVWGFLGAPRVPPGEYTVTMKVGDFQQQQSFRVLKDPRLTISEADIVTQVAFMNQMREKLNQIYKSVRLLRSVREQTRSLVDLLEQTGKTPGDLKTMSQDLAKRLAAVEEELMQPRNEADQDTENFPSKLDNQLAYVYMQMDYSDGPITNGQRERVGDLMKAIDQQLAQLKGILDADVAAFNKRASELGAGPILLK